MVHFMASLYSGLSTQGGWDGSLLMQTIYLVINQVTVSKLLSGSNACNGIMYFVPLCYIQIQAELDLSPLTNVAPRFVV